MKTLSFALALLALLEVNVFFLRQRAHNLRSNARQEEINSFLVKFGAIQEELVRNLGEMQLRLEKLEPPGDPLAVGRLDER